MEIKRKESKSGKVFRIWSWTACNEMFYEIEYLRVYKDSDTEKDCFNAWFSAFDPQKVFHSYEEAKAEFDKLLAD